MTTEPQRVARAFRPRVTVMGLTMVAFGLLLWARFILVTGHPKTAYAAPDPQPQAIVHAETP